jgi:hypothetical protein
MISRHYNKWHEKTKHEKLSLRFRVQIGIEKKKKKKKNYNWRVSLDCQPRGHGDSPVFYILTLYFERQNKSV